jgi:hypothetical protein
MATMDELASLAENLNSESNEINDIIAAWNAKLAARNLGLEEWLYPDEDHVQTGYAKVQDKWQLAARHCAEIRWVLNYNARDKEDGHCEPVPGTKFTVTPLLEASRELRIRAVGHIPDLIDNLKDEAEARLRSIREAKKKLADER